MSVTIYQYGTPNVARATVKPDATSQQSVTLMGEDTLTLTFVVPEPIQFQIGDYCFFYNRLYQINSLPKVNQAGPRDFTYTMVVESEMYDLGKVAFLFLDANNQFTDGVFDFRGTPRDFGDLLIYNLQRVYPIAGWKLGNVIDAQFITQNFNSQNCLEALKTIASIFQTEYLVEGKTINIFQRQSSSGIVLKQGAGEALLTIEQNNQTNANLITRLYAFGSTRNIVNIPAGYMTTAISYRGGSTRLRMGDINYLEKNIDKYKVWEKIIIFDGTTADVKTNAPLPEIYPHRTGTITAVDDYLNFYDDVIDFNVNDYTITGLTAQIVFNTGLLAGYTFDINSYDNITKKFTINQQNSNPNLIIPTVALTPMVGDEYVLINIATPQSYIDAAEAALRSAAHAYLDENCIPPVAFTVTCNSLYFKRNNVQFSLAQSIQIESDLLILNKTTRITSYTRNILKPYMFTMVLADTVKPNSIIVKLINGI